MNAQTTKTADTLLWSEPRASSAGIKLSLAHAFRSVSEWSRRRRMEAELKALSDRELADIGLTRGDIGNVAHRR